MSCCTIDRLIQILIHLAILLRQLLGLLYDRSQVLHLHFKIFLGLNQCPDDRVLFDCRLLLLQIDLSSLVSILLLSTPPQLLREFLFVDQQFFVKVGEVNILVL